MVSGRPARSATSMAAAVPLSGWILPKKSRYVPGCRPCLEGGHVDAVVDGGDVVEPLVAVSLADGDVVAALVVLLVDGHDALGREAVDGRDDRRLHQAAVGERQEVEAVVDQVELAGTLEERRDMQALPDLGVQRRVLGVSAWDTGAEVAQLVTESAVANSVTSTPRLTRPSVSSDTNCSQGP